MPGNIFAKDIIVPIISKRTEHSEVLSIDGIFGDIQSFARYFYQYEQSRIIDPRYSLTLKFEILVLPEASSTIVNLH